MNFFFLNLSSPLNFNIEPTRSSHPPIVYEYTYVYDSHSLFVFDLNPLRFLQKRVSNKFLIINKKNVERPECEILFAFSALSNQHSPSMRKTKRREDKFQSQTRLPKIRLNFTDPYQRTSAKRCGLKIARKTTIPGRKRKHYG